MSINKWKVQCKYLSQNQITLIMQLFMCVANSAVSVTQFIDCNSLCFLFHSINVSVPERPSVLSYLQRKGYIHPCYIQVIDSSIINKRIIFNPFILATELYKLLKSLPFKKTEQNLFLTTDHIIYFT